MTTADVQIFDGVYTVTVTGWTGPDPEFVRALNAGYPPRDTTSANPVLRTARRLARELGGEVIAERTSAFLNAAGNRRSA